MDAVLDNWRTAWVEEACPRLMRRIPRDWSDRMLTRRIELLKESFDGWRDVVFRWSSERCRLPLNCS